jgi:hypothetical protein
VIVFPLVAAGVSTIFAIQLLTTWTHRRQFPHLTWGIAMIMFAVASVAVTAGVGGGWDPTLFRVYWLFGAVLNVPYLALGSVALLARRNLSALMLLLVVAATLIAVVTVATATAHFPVTAPKNIPRGSQVWGKGTLVAQLGRYMSIPAYVIVVLVALISSRRRTLAASRVRGLWLIAIGATITATGGPMARYGRGSIFSVLLAVGVIVMFVGFRLSTRVGKPPPSAAEPL